MPSLLFFFYDKRVRSVVQLSEGEDTPGPDFFNYVRGVCDRSHERLPLCKRPY
jgi:hypothetical protein